MADDVRVEGMEQVSVFAREAERMVPALVKAWMVLIEGRLRKYPRPVGNPAKAHYRRGYGFVWPVKTDREPEPGVEVVGPGWHGKPTSERLGASWGMQEMADQVVLGNTASYAPGVQSSVEQESNFEGRWVTDEEAIDLTRPTFTELVLEALDRAAERARHSVPAGG